MLRISQVVSISEGEEEFLQGFRVLGASENFQRVLGASENFQYLFFPSDS